MTILGRKIKRRLKDLGLTQAELSERVKLSQVMIHKLISGKSKETARIVDLARALECDPEWLLSQDFDDAPPHRNLIGREPATSQRPRLEEPAAGYLSRLPLISEIQGDLDQTLSDHEYPQENLDWIETSSDVGRRAFGIKITEDSMTNPYGTPSIPIGSVVIIDASTPPTSGRIVCVKIGQNTQLFLKKYVVDGPNSYLVSLNPAYKAIPFDDDCTILGVAKRVEFDL